MNVLTSKFAKHTAIAVAVLIVAIALFVGVGKTIAYFTTYAEAKGTVEVTLGDKTTINEDMKENSKLVQINNDSDSQPVFVRVKAFSGSTYPFTYESDGNWSPGNDGYYYYGPVLNPGEKTTELKVTIKFPEDADVGDNFNVVVIYETTPVIYDAAGNPQANWKNILDNGNIPQGGDK